MATKFLVGPYLSNLFFLVLFPISCNIVILFIIYIIYHFKLHALNSILFELILD